MRTPLNPRFFIEFWMLRKAFIESPVCYSAKWRKSVKYFYMCAITCAIVTWSIAPDFSEEWGVG